MVSQKRFREDLFFRLNTITIELPPLRERKEDIAKLADFFIEKISKEMKVDPVPLTKKAKEMLVRYSWPGNIRELENEIRRCLALKGETGEIDYELLSDDVRNG